MICFVVINKTAVLIIKPGVIFRDISIHKEKKLGSLGD